MKPLKKMFNGSGKLKVDFDLPDSHSATTVVGSVSSSSCSNHFSCSRATFKSCTPSEEVVLELFQGLNDHDPEVWKRTFHSDARVRMNTRSVEVAKYGEQFLALYKSFPDYNVTVHSVEETEPGIIHAMIQTSGTHTGDNFKTAAFPEELKAKGDFCRNDVEYVSFVVEKQKIAAMRASVESEATKLKGPNGFYRQLYIAQTLRRKGGHRKRNTTTK